MKELKEEHMEKITNQIMEGARETGQIGEQFLARLRGGMNESLAKSSLWICPECEILVQIMER